MNNIIDLDKKRKERLSEEDTFLRGLKKMEETEIKLKIELMTKMLYMHIGLTFLIVMLTHSLPFFGEWAEIIEINTPISFMVFTISMVIMISLLIYIIPKLYIKFYKRIKVIKLESFSSKLTLFSVVLTINGLILGVNYIVFNDNWKMNFNVASGVSFIIHIIISILLLIITSAILTFICNKLFKGKERVK